MVRVILVMIIYACVSSFSAKAANDLDNHLQAAFIRDGDLWTFINNKEKQITTSGNIFGAPKWSPDGKWILYQREEPSEFRKNEYQSEVWVYQIETGEKKKLFYDGFSPSWAPDKNLVAFTAQGILNISDLVKFSNIATGVSSFLWLPKGNGVLLSTTGNLRPDGWTSSILFKKNIPENYHDIILFGGVDHFFTLPKEVGISNEKKVISVYADILAFSPSKKWISFIVSPTASWSMDSNMLCVISNEGKNFEVIDEVILDVGEPKWAPTTDTLAFIGGGGRIVFGFKNKALKLKEMPASKTYTPENYIDLDFDWVTDKELVTSRMEEKEWSNNFSQHPLPSLYSINIDTNKQIKITEPPMGLGDYRPQYIETIDKLVWLRGANLIETDRDLWIASPDGKGAEEWIKNVYTIEFYQGKK